MSYALRFSRSNSFKVAPDKEVSFQNRVAELGLNFTHFLNEGEKVFGVWPTGEDEGSWQFPPDYEDNEDAYEDDEPIVIIAKSLSPFLLDGSVMVLAEVGAEFSGGDTISIGGSAVAVNNKGEMMEWQRYDIVEAAKRLGTECQDFEWRGSTTNRLK